MPAPRPRVIVVGAGFGGIGVGVKLKKAGIDTFTIYESSLGVGGTWWDNTYPGAEVDVNSNLYCYSFKSQEWTRTHAQQAELQKYLEETVDEFALRSHVQLGITVTSAAWDDERHIWTVTLDSGAVDECHVLVSAVGFLNIPRYPEWPGLADFAGPKFHTSRWEHQHDLSDKVVALVGTGSTAAQVVPAIQPIVKKLYVFQREPGWVMPKGERRPDRRRTATVRKALATRPGPGEVAGDDREEPVGGGDVPTRQQAEQLSASRVAWRTSHASSPTALICARRSRPITPIRASGRFWPAPSIPRSRRRTSNSCHVPSRASPRAGLSTRRASSEQSTSSSWRPGSRPPTTWVACRSPGARARPSMTIGPANRGRFSVSPCRGSPTSSCCTGPARTAESS